MAHPVDELTMKYFLVDKIENKVCIHSDSRHCNAMPDQVRILFITTYFQALKYLHCCSNFPNENSIRWKHTLFKVSHISSAIWHTYTHSQQKYSENPQQKCNPFGKMFPSASVSCLSEKFFTHLSTSLVWVWYPSAGCWAHTLWLFLMQFSYILTR